MRLFFSTFLSATVLSLALMPGLSAAQVELGAREGGFQLVVDGAPFIVHGAGGDASKKLLADIGGNTCRTWGGDDIKDKLDEAHANGLKVVVGIWLGHARHGFNWADQAAVASQFTEAKHLSEHWKDHPAVLAWGIGNEMEGFEAGDDVHIWKAIQELAVMAKQIDPKHPTMTTTSEIGGKRVELINKFCPALDIIGINSYGGAPSLPKRYREAGGKRPYIVTEYGIPGTWEIGKNSFDSVDELPSTAKGPIYRNVYETLAKDPLCIGSIAFAWGAKVEATATWYGMLLPNGERLEAVDQLAAAWGHPVRNRCPTITKLSAPTTAVKPGATVTVTTTIADPEGDPLVVDWVLAFDPQNYNTGGDAQAAPTTYPESIAAHSQNSCTLTMPASGGLYRIYAYAHDGKGGAALANAVLKVDAPILAPKPAKAALPTKMIGDGAVTTWSPSGFMGDTAAIVMAATSAVQPHSGATCLQVTFAKGDGWGGVVWQSPANDWGTAPGGLDLSAAKKLTFWARGDSGGEKVKFGFGIIGIDKQFHDSAKAELSVTLTKDWTNYAIDLANKDMSCIKSGFSWVVGGQGQPVTFFVDDAIWE